MLKMKKGAWLVVALLALSMAFVGCGNGNGSDEKVTVTFDATGEAKGTVTFTGASPVEIVKGTAVTRPANDPASSDPEEEFRHWALSGGTAAYVFTNPVNENITLVAIWGPPGGHTPTTSILFENGQWAEELGDVTIEHGELIEGELREVEGGNDASIRAAFENEIDVSEFTMIVFTGTFTNGHWHGGWLFYDGTKEAQWWRGNEHEGFYDMTKTKVFIFSELPNSLDLEKISGFNLQAGENSVITKIELIDLDPADYFTWTLAEFLEVNNNTVSNWWDSRPLQGNAGAPTFTISDGGIDITDRDNNAHGLDIFIDAGAGSLNLDLTTKAYTVIVEGNVIGTPSAGNIQIVMQGTEENWPWIDSSGDLDQEEDVEFKMIGVIDEEFVDDSGAPQPKIRINSHNGATTSFRISTIIIREIWF
jgi:hypothetical protein